MTVRLATLSLLLVTLALAACGGDDKGKGIPSSTASQLLGELTAVENRFDQGSVGACEDVLDESVPTIQKRIDSLPEDTDSELRSALEESFTNLRTLSEEECDTRRQEAEDKTTTETTPPPTTTETTPPPTTTTETTPPTTTETTPKPKPKPKNNGNGNGNGNGQNGSGGTQGLVPPEAGPGGGVDPN